jgi:hypothetical protein
VSAPETVWKRAHTAICEATAQGHLSISIPARPDRDHDFIVVSAIDRGEELEKRLERAADRLDLLAEHLGPEQAKLARRWAEEARAGMAPAIETDDYEPPQPSSPAPDTARGIYDKFQVMRRDGSSAPGGKHEHCEYFVLDLDHDKYARPALRAYADACSYEFPVLARDLRATSWDLPAPPSPAEPGAPALRSLADEAWSIGTTLTGDSSKRLKALSAKLHELAADPPAPEPGALSEERGNWTMPELIRALDASEAEIRRLRASPSAREGQGAAPGKDGGTDGR